MIDLENTINHIEATIFAFEKNSTVQIIVDRDFSSTGSSYGTIPTALNDFVKRLMKVDGIIDSIIKQNIRKNQDKASEPFDKTSSYSP
jgi:hypothetical protein